MSDEKRNPLEVLQEIVNARERLRMAQLDHSQAKGRLKDATDDMRDVAPMRRRQADLLAWARAWWAVDDLKHKVAGLEIDLGSALLDATTVVQPSLPGLDGTTITIRHASPDGQMRSVTATQDQMQRALKVIDKETGEILEPATA